MATLVLIGLSSSPMWASPTGPRPTPPPLPPVQVPEPQIWQAISPLSQGQILYRAPDSKRWVVWQEGQMLSTGLTEFKVRLHSDHRWTKYGPLVSTLTKKGLTFTIKRWTDTRLHDASFQPSVWTSESSQVRIPSGEYRVTLGEKAQGVLKVKP